MFVSKAKCKSTRIYRFDGLAIVLNLASATIGIDWIRGHSCVIKSPAALNCVGRGGIVISQYDKSALAFVLCPDHRDGHTPMKRFAKKTSRATS